MDDLQTMTERWRRYYSWEGGKKVCYQILPDQLTMADWERIAPGRFTNFVKQVLNQFYGSNEPKSEKQLKEGCSGYLGVRYLNIVNRALKKAGQDYRLYPIQDYHGSNIRYSERAYRVYKVRKIEGA